MQLSVNGEKHEADVEPRLLLVHLLREVLRLTGTHIGCDTTRCGACTVLLDGRPVKSCTVFAVQADGTQLMTVEGLEQDGKLHPLQDGFMEEHGLQCGFCTPGMMMTGYAFLEKQPEPDRGRDPLRHLRQPVPLHRLREHRQGDPVRGGQAAAGRRLMAPERPSPEVGGMGHSIKRKEDPRFIRGKGNYVDDVQLPGMLYLDIVRSPYAHAKISKIDAAQGAGDPRRARGDHRPGSGQVQPALDADAHVGHADGAADREGDVPGAGGGGGARDRAATPPPTAPPRSRSSTSRCRWSSTRSRRSSPTPRCCAPTRRTRRTTTSGTGRRATGPPPTGSSARPT